MRFHVRTENPEWHRWYAWHPVKFGDAWVWLEYVERKERFSLRTLFGVSRYANDPSRPIPKLPEPEPPIMWLDDQDGRE